MRRLRLISIDLVLVASATMIAVMLRGNFDSVTESIQILMPYVFISVACTSVIFLLGGVDRTPWRYSSVADHLQVMVLSVLAILVGLVLTFALNRLEPVARSLPVFQAALVVSSLVFARSVARFWHSRQIHINEKACFDAQRHDTVLVVGVNTITELYILSATEFASQRVRVAGVLAEEPIMRGRAIQQKPVLGTIEELQEILQSLEVHGVAVDRIVVATAKDRLRPRALEALAEAEKSSTIVVQFLSEQLGFERPFETAAVLSGQKRSDVPEQRALARLERIDLDNTNSNFVYRKRMIDFFGAAFLAIALSPVLLIIALVVALDVGFPLIFWQQRPGLYGRPIKLYKFRTMRAAHDRDQRRIPDDQRSSPIGQLIRRARFDELPQLYNVLAGDMSLIGPRPLLPRDQSSDYAARLLVRPGITGWAQVNGGRIVSASDKCILDIWYAQNASFVLDLKIALITVKMIFFGDRINIEAVNQARNDLGLNAQLRTTIVPAE